ncbi:MAG: hypothetical protein E7635_02485 [Ruminococcaceae bacterium]|nr:hypothetical protein [Oscillospiraceae bacterium]
MQTLEYLFAVITALAVHELGHLFMMLILKVKIYSARTRFWGVLIGADYSKSSYVKELLVSISGILANILGAHIFFLLKQSEYAYAMLAYGLFNLLPLYFLDGGDILRTLLLIIGMSESTVYKLMRRLSVIISIFIWIVAIYFAMKGASITLLLTSVYMISVCFFDKTA